MHHNLTFITTQEEDKLSYQLVEVAYDLEANGDYFNFASLVDDQFVFEYFENDYSKHHWLSDDENERFNLNESNLIEMAIQPYITENTFIMDVAVKDEENSGKSSKVSQVFSDGKNL